MAKLNSIETLKDSLYLLKSRRSECEQDLNDVEAKKLQYEEDLNNFDDAIDGIEGILSNSKSAENHSEEKVVEAPKAKTARRKAIKITENEVRDAIIEFVKNPPDEKRYFPTSPGFFTTKTITLMLGLRESRDSQDIKKILEKFEKKEIIESKKYKAGKQYRYIPPDTLSNENNIKKSYNVASSAPDAPERSTVPGVNNTRIHVRDKDIEKMLREARKQGFVISRTGSDHIRVSSPDLKKSCTLTGTGNKPYQVTMARTEMQKIGVKI